MALRRQRIHRDEGDTPQGPSAALSRITPRWLNYDFNINGGPEPLDSRAEHGFFFKLELAIE